jgi:hypothetical protein
MAPNSESQKHEEGTFSVEGRVPRRVGGERKINLYEGFLEYCFDVKKLPRDQSSGHIMFMA